MLFGKFYNPFVFDFILLQQTFRAFGFAHSGYVKAELVRAGLSKEKAAKAALQMEHLVRMPYATKRVLLLLLLRSGAAVVAR